MITEIGGSYRNKGKDISKGIPDIPLFEMNWAASIPVMVVIYLIASYYIPSSHHVTYLVLTVNIPSYPPVNSHIME